jgi:hypothetical protein
MQVLDSDSEIKRLLEIRQKGRSSPSRRSLSPFKGFHLPDNNNQPPPARFVYKTKVEGCRNDTNSHQNNQNSQRALKSPDLTGSSSRCDGNAGY